MIDTITISSVGIIDNRKVGKSVKRPSQSAYPQLYNLCFREKPHNFTIFKPMGCSKVQYFQAIPHFFKIIQHGNSRINMTTGYTTSNSNLHLKSHSFNL